MPAVAVRGCVKQSFGVSNFTYRPIPQNGNAVTHLPYHGQIMADKQDRQPKLFLQVLQQVQNLRLNADIES